MFEFIVTAVSIGALVILLIRFPAVRLVAVIAVFFGSAVVWWIIDRDQARRALAHQLIAAEQIQLTGLRVAAKDSAHHSLSGSVRNASSYALTELIIRVSAMDCPINGEPADECETQGEGLARAHSPWRVPPREARDIEVDFRMGELSPPHGELRWSYSVVETRASLDPP